MSARAQPVRLGPRAAAVLVGSLVLEAVLLQQAVGVLPATASELAGTSEALAVEQRIASALCTGVLAAALTAWTWWCVSVLQAVRLAGCPPGRPPALGRGSGWVRAAALALGVGAAGLAVGPASADPGSGRPCEPAVSAPAAPAGVGSFRLDGLTLPVLPAAAPKPAAGSTVVVAPGDSLWTLAAARLGPAANPAAVDRLWRRWYSANRAAIGSDPDLLVPGKRLRLPPPTRTDQRTQP